FDASSCALNTFYEASTGLCHLIEDTVLRDAICISLGYSPSHVITVAELRSLTSIEISAGVSSMAGLEYAVNLTTLVLMNGTIEDISPVAYMHNLVYLDLRYNPISDIFPILSNNSYETIYMDNICLSYSYITDFAELLDTDIFTLPETYSDCPITETLELSLDSYQTYKPIYPGSSDYSLVCVYGYYYDYSSGSCVEDTSNICITCGDPKYKKCIKNYDPVPSCICMESEKYGDKCQYSSNIPDYNLRIALCGGSSLCDEENFVNFDDFSNESISDLRGIETIFPTATNQLLLDNNLITDLAPLSKIPSLVYLDIENLFAPSIAPLAHLPSLLELLAFNIASLPIYLSISESSCSPLPLANVNVSPTQCSGDLCPSFTRFEVYNPLTNMLECAWGAKSVDGECQLIHDFNLRIRIVEILRDMNPDNMTDYLPLSSYFITIDDLRSLIDVDLSNANVSSLRGLEYAINLETIDLSNNELVDYTPLLYLPSLVSLDLSNNNLCSSAFEIPSLFVMEYQIAQNNDDVSPSITSDADSQSCQCEDDVQLYFNIICAPRTNLKQCRLGYYENTQASTMSCVKDTSGTCEYLDARNMLCYGDYQDSDVVVPYSGGCIPGYYGGNGTDCYEPVSFIFGEDISFEYSGYLGYIPYRKFFRTTTPMYHQTVEYSSDSMSVYPQIDIYDSDGNIVITFIQQYTSAIDLDVDISIEPLPYPVVDPIQISLLSSASCPTTLFFYYGFEECPEFTYGTTCEYVYIPDDNLRLAILTVLGREDDTDTDVTVDEMLTFETLRVSGVSDLTGIRYASNLTELDLVDGEFNIISVDLDQLTYLSNLTTLNLANTNVSDISNLGLITNLKVVSLSNTLITDDSILIEEGSDYSYLVDGEFNIISVDLDQLTYLSNLTTLNLANTNVSDISNLGLITNLKVVSLSNTLITDDSILIEEGSDYSCVLPNNIEGLDISYNAGLSSSFKWMNYCFLDSLIDLNLSGLDFDYCPFYTLFTSNIYDYSPLTSLSLSDVTITSSPLSDDCIEYTYGNTIVLINEFEFTSLDLSSNNIYSVVFLANNTNSIIDLNLSSNMISDVSPLYTYSPETVFELNILDNPIHFGTDETPEVLYYKFLSIERTGFLFLSADSTYDVCSNCYCEGDEDYPSFIENNLVCTETYPGSDNWYVVCASDSYATFSDESVDPLTCTTGCAGGCTYGDVCQYIDETAACNSIFYYSYPEFDDCIVDYLMSNDLYYDYDYLNQTFSAATLLVIDSELDCSDTSIHELDGIEYLRNVPSIDLSENSIVELPSGIETLCNLVQLNLSSNNIDAIRYLPMSLEYLDLSYNENLFDLYVFESKDLTPPNLYYLDISGIENGYFLDIANYDGLALSLETLKYSQVTIYDDSLYSLSEFESLQELDLSQVQLEIKGNYIDEFDLLPVVDTLCEIPKLNLGGNNISNLSFLGTCPSNTTDYDYPCWEYLYLYENRIFDPSPLYHISANDLDLSFNYIQLDASSSEDLFAKFVNFQYITGTQTLPINIDYQYSSGCELDGMTDMIGLDLVCAETVPFSSNWQLVCASYAQTIYSSSVTTFTCSSDIPCDGGCSYSDECFVVDSLAMTTECLRTVEEDALDAALGNLLSLADYNSEYGISIAALRSLSSLPASNRYLSSLSSSISSLRGLQHADLLYLDLEGMSELVSLEYIMYLVNLYYLSIRSTGITTLAHISNLINLKILYIDYTDSINSESMYILCNFTILEVLTMSKTDFDSESSVVFPSCPAEGDQDSSPFLESLIELRIDNVNIDSLDPIACQDEITTISMDGAINLTLEELVSNIGPALDLYDFSAEGCGLVTSDLFELENLSSSFKTLKLSNNAIDDISPLFAFRDTLEALDVSYNTICGVIETDSVEESTDLLFNLPNLSYVNTNFQNTTLCTETYPDICGEDYVSVETQTICMEIWEGEYRAECDVYSYKLVDEGSDDGSFSCHPLWEINYQSGYECYEDVKSLSNFQCVYDTVLDTVTAECIEGWYGYNCLYSCPLSQDIESMCNYGTCDEETHECICDDLYTGTVCLYVNVPDPELKMYLCSLLNLGDDCDISASDMSGIDSIDLTDLGVSDLSGLEFASNLSILDLSYNPVSDLEPLSSLQSLSILALAHTSITDLTDIEGLDLSYLDISGASNVDSDQIGYDIASSFSTLNSLIMDGLEIESIGFIIGFTQLTYISLANNYISDPTPFYSLASSSPNLSIRIDISINRICGSLSMFEVFEYHFPGRILILEYQENECFCEEEYEFGSGNNVTCAKIWDGEWEYICNAVSYLDTSVEFNPNASTDETSGCVELDYYNEEFISYCFDNFITHQQCVALNSIEDVQSIDDLDIQCISGWYDDPSSEELVCSLECLNGCSSILQGICDLNTHLCECYIPYGAEDCSEQQCINSTCEVNSIGGECIVEDPDTDPYTLTCQCDLEEDVSIFMDDPGWWVCVSRCDDYEGCGDEASCIRKSGSDNEWWCICDEIEYYYDVNENLCTISDNCSGCTQGQGVCVVEELESGYLSDPYCKCYPNGSWFGSTCSSICPVDENDLTCSGPEYGTCDEETNQCTCLADDLGGDSCNEISFGDDMLETAIINALDLETDFVTLVDLESLSNLVLDFCVSSFQGLEYATNLAWLTVNAADCEEPCVMEAEISASTLPESLFSLSLFDVGITGTITVINEESQEEEIVPYPDFSFLSELTILNLSNNSDYDIASIDVFPPSLQWLELSNTAISSFQNIPTESTDLMHLTLQGCTNLDISSVVNDDFNFARIEFLDMSETELTSYDLIPLVSQMIATIPTPIDGSDRNGLYLNLISNYISDPSPIYALTDILTILDLRYNYICDGDSTYTIPYKIWGDDYSFYDFMGSFQECNCSDNFNNSDIVVKVSSTADASLLDNKVCMETAPNSGNWYTVCAMDSITSNYTFPDSDNPTVPEFTCTQTLISEELNCIGGCEYGYECKYDPNTELSSCSEIIPNEYFRSCLSSSIDDLDQVEGLLSIASLRSFEQIICESDELADASVLEYSIEGIRHTTSAQEVSITDQAFLFDITPVWYKINLESLDFSGSSQISILGMGEGNGTSSSDSPFLSSTYPYLKFIDFSNTGLGEDNGSNDPIIDLSETMLIPLEAIEEFDVSENPYLSSFSGIYSITSTLNTLHISSTSITDLSPLYYNENDDTYSTNTVLTFLDISSINISEKEQMQYLTSLSILKANNAVFVNNDLFYLRDLPLTELYLGYSEISEKVYSNSNVISDPSYLFTHSLFILDLRMNPICGDVEEIISTLYHQCFIIGDAERSTVVYFDPPSESWTCPCNSESYSNTSDLLEFVEPNIANNVVCSETLPGSGNWFPVCSSNSYTEFSLVTTDDSINRTFSCYTELMINGDDIPRDISCYGGCEYGAMCQVFIEESLSSECVEIVSDSALHKCVGELLYDIFDPNLYSEFIFNELDQTYTYSVASLRLLDDVSLDCASYSGDITDLSGIEYLVFVDELHLAGDQTYTYSVASLRLLDDVSLDCASYSGDITDLSGIEYLVFVDELHLAGGSFSSIDNFSSMINLQYIDVSFSVIAELPNLSYLYLLDYLDLSYCYDINLISTSSEPLLIFPECITILKIDETSIAQEEFELQIAERLCDLSYLSMINTSITDISSFAEYGQINTLETFIANNLDNSCDLTVKKMTVLETLELSDCNLQDIPDLSSSNSTLTHLNLSDNSEIYMLEPLILDSNLSNLTHLDLSGCSLSDISPIFHLPTLGYLDVSSNLLCAGLVDADLSDPLASNLVPKFVNSPSISIVADSQICGCDDEFSTIDAISEDIVCARPVPNRSDGPWTAVCSSHSYTTYMPDDSSMAPLGFTCTSVLDEVSVSCDGGCAYGQECRVSTESASAGMSFCADVIVDAGLRAVVSELVPAEYKEDGSGLFSVASLKNVEQVEGDESE
ncbi:hypothetical protein ADUPG1_012186, partial [Aduncisulcus paluster]